MKNLLFLLTIFITVAFSACFDDKGNYDYHEINELQVTGLPVEKQIKYRNADTLRATPEIIATADDGSRTDRYSFKWEAVTKLKAGDVQTTSYTIGEERNLSYFVMIPDGEYDVNCLVKDTLTGVTWKGSFELKVTTQLNEGWLVLSDVDGYTRLDLISMSAKEEMVVRDLLKDAPRLKGPKKLNIVYDMYFISTGDPRFYLITETTTTKLNMDTYEWDEGNDIRYEMLEYPDNFIASVRTAGMGWELLVSDKYVYGGTTYGQQVLFGVPINFIEGDGDNYFNVAPAVGVNTSYSAYQPKRVLYDTSNKRFVMTGNTMKNCTLMPEIAKPLFPWVTGKDFVYMANSRYDGGSVYTILQDPGKPSERYMYVLKVSGSTVTQSKYLKLDYPEIDKATCFAVHPSLPWLFYAVGNTVYLCDLEGHYAKPVHLDGETITMLKFHVFVGLTANPTMQNKLIVGTMKSGSGLNGVVRTYDVPTVFGDEFGTPSKHEGFGKPVDVTYRER